MSHLAWACPALLEVHPMSTAPAVPKTTAKKLDGMPKEESAKLMARFVRTRERPLFEVLFERHKLTVLRHVRRFVRAEARAEELAQEVFIRVYTTKNYEAKASFQSWLLRVATNVCLNDLRRPEQRAPHEDVHAEGQELSVDETTPESELVRAQLALRIEAALTALPPKQRAAFLMARQDGLSHEAIAHALSTSVSAVKSLIHRALDSLRNAALETGETT